MRNIIDDKVVNLNTN